MGGEGAPASGRDGLALRIVHSQWTIEGAARATCDAGAQPASDAAIALAAAITSAAALRLRCRENRVSGAEMPTDATISPFTSRIGAATQRNSSAYSPSSMAKPSTRICAHDLREFGQRDDGVLRVGVERGPSEQRLQLVEIEVGEQRLAVRGAVERHELAGLPRHRDHLPGRRVVIDEERLAALADRQSARSRRACWSAPAGARERRCRGRCAHTSATAARPSARGCSPCCRRDWPETAAAAGCWPDERRCCDRSR